MFILWFAGWAVFGNHESALRVDKEKVTIEEVSQGIFHDYIRIMGNVEPLTFSQLTVQEGGNVKEILVEEGEMVKAGEVIIRLESKHLETEILNSKDRFAEEENSVQNSLLDLEREELNLQQERLTLELDVERKKRKYLQNKQLFEEGLIAAVNLGGDSDSIGAVFGQIAGAYYGFDAIPDRWVKAVKTWRKVDELIEGFLDALGC